MDLPPVGRLPMINAGRAYHNIYANRSAFNGTEQDPSRPTLLPPSSIFFYTIAPTFSILVSHLRTNLKPKKIRIVGGGFSIGRLARGDEKSATIGPPGVMLARGPFIARLKGLKYAFRSGVMSAVGWYLCRLLGEPSDGAT